MPTIITLAGSPSTPSRSSAILDYAQQIIESQGITVQALQVRDLNPIELLHAQWDGETLKTAIANVLAAQGIVICTPVYKASYTGILKAFLDVLPSNALNGKIVLPIVSGGSVAHSLVLDYALKPVLAALGAEDIHQGLYLIDNQYQHDNGTRLQFLDLEAKKRLDTALDRFVKAIQMSSIPMED